jgi:hypothetical protein
METDNAKEVEKIINSFLGEKWSYS